MERPISEEQYKTIWNVIRPNMGLAEAYCVPGKGQKTTANPELYWNEVTKYQEQTGSRAKQAGYLQNWRKKKSICT